MFSIFCFNTQKPNRATTGAESPVGAADCVKIPRFDLHPKSPKATHAAVAVTFSAFNQYAGVGIGEHLGYLFTALWTILIGTAMMKSPHFRGWLGWVGIFSAVGILFGLLEPTGVPLAGLINAFAYIVWAIWMVIVGIFVL